MKQYLEIGAIVNTHGIRGDVKVLPWCDSAEMLCEFDRLYIGENHTPIDVESAYVQKNCVILHLHGVDTKEDADQMRGTILYMNRDDVSLAEGVYFIQDLIGLTVQDCDSGETYGVLSDVIQTGANDVYEIVDETGKKRYLPAIPDVVIETDLSARLMKIRPLKGLFDDAD